MKEFVKVVHGLTGLASRQNSQLSDHHLQDSEILSPSFKNDVEPQLGNIGVGNAIRELGDPANTGFFGALGPTTDFQGLRKREAAVTDYGYKERLSRMTRK